MKFCIIIPTYNEARDIAATPEALIAYLLPDYLQSRLGRIISLGGTNNERTGIII